MTEEEYKKCPYCGSLTNQYENGVLYRNDNDWLVPRSPARRYWCNYCEDYFIVNLIENKEEK